MIILALPVSIVAAVLFLSGLASWWLCSLTILLGLACIAWWWRVPTSLIAKFLTLASLIAFGAQWGLLAKQHFQWLPIAEGQSLYLTGTVTDIPRQFYQQNQARVEIQCLGSQPDSCDLVRSRIPFWIRYALVSVAKEQVQFTPGQTWRLQVEAKAVVSKKGAAVIDIERWLKSQHVVAKFKVTPRSTPELIAKSNFNLDQVRTRLNRHIKRLDDEYKGESLSPYPILLALVSGDRSLMNDAHWNLFNRTGTTHLVAISGLHLGLVAWIVMVFCKPIFKRWLWFNQRKPASTAAGAVALAVATFYAALAGFAIPTQRALIMLAVYVVLTWFGRARQLWFGLAAAFLLVLLLDPLACMSIGFWFSFIAVYCIFWLVGGSVLQVPAWKRWPTIQIGIFFALGPILLWKMHAVSIVSPLTNTFAIPIVGWLLAPLALLWVCLWSLMGDAANFLLAFGAWLADLLIWLLQWFSQTKYGLFKIGPQTAVAMTLAYVGVVWACTAGLPGRLFSPFLMLPLLLIKAPEDGVYIAGHTSPRVILQDANQISVISHSQWPQLLPKWQQQWLDYWGITLPRDASYNHVDKWWLGEGLLLTQYHFETGFLGQPMISSVQYQNLCDEAQLQISPYLVTIFKDARYPKHCAVRLERDDKAWLIWPTSSKRSQATALKQQPLLGNETIILFPAKKHRLDAQLLTLVSQYEADIVALKPMPDEVQQQLNVFNIEVATVKSGTYRYFPIDSDAHLVKEITK